MIYNKYRYRLKYPEIFERAEESPTFRYLFSYSRARISDKHTEKAGCIYLPYPPQRGESLVEIIGVLAHELYHSLENPETDVEGSLYSPSKSVE
jgi:hypothetical protein